MCYDAGLQEAQLDHDVEMPPRRDRRSRSSGRGSRVGEGGQYSGHCQSSSDNRRFRRPSPHGWKHVVELAETLGASVWDVGSRLNFPSDHPLTHLGP